MPTDADWGRLYAYETTGDIGLVMPPSSYYYRDFLSGSWADLSIGFIHRMSATGTVPGVGNDYTDCVDEALDVSQFYSVFQFGLSRSDPATLALQLVNNPYFIGWAGILDSATQIVSLTPEITHLAPTKIYNGSGPSVTGSASSFVSQDGTSSTPFGMYGIRYLYNSKTQVLCMNHATQSNVLVTDITDNTSTLTTFLNGISDDIVTPQAQFSVPSIENYKTFLINWPFMANRLFIQAIGAIQNA